MPEDERRLAMQELGRKGGRAKAGAAQDGKAAAAGDTSSILTKLRAQAKRGDVAAARLVLEHERRDQQAGVTVRSLALAQAIEQLPAAARTQLHELVTALGQEGQQQAETESDPIEESDGAMRAREAVQEAEGHPPEPSESRDASATESRNC